MKKVLLMISAVAILIMPVTAMGAKAAEGGEDIKPVPIPISPNKIDLSGTWNYTSAAQTVTGPCPAGKPSSGTMKIAQTGKGVTLSYTSGAVCVPPSVCTYAGNLSGNQLTASNHAVVDDEGGNVTNALGLVVASNESMNGLSSSRYSHPGGMECHWEGQITITRKLNKQ